MMTDGQSWALEQLNEIAAKSKGALEIVDVRGPTGEGTTLSATVSIQCAGYPRAEGGIPYRPREKLIITIPADFPLKVPSLYFTHDRYGAVPHVQWGNSICLYQAPETEWQPEDGMYGFIKRMDDWLRAGAANALEPIGLPMHPPVAYAHDEYFVVVPTQNTPVVAPPWWHGFARITKETKSVLHLGEWITVDEYVEGERIVPAILLPGDMPFEYPTTVAALKSVLEVRGVPLSIVRLLLTMGALANPENKPLVFILGAAMRGTSGGEKLQHLAAWHLNAAKAQELRDTYRAATPNKPVDDAWFEGWAGATGINWCSVLEDRPEIVVARDNGTSAQYWRDRHVAILGCGAIGSMIAMLLARAGVGKLQLYDKAVVKPGLLVRQIFDRHQIGYTKVSATGNNVRYISDKIAIAEFNRDILGVLNDGEARNTLLGADVVINATASRRISSALEFQLRHWPKAHPPIASMAVGHRADAAVMTLAQTAVPGIAHDLDRRLKIGFANSASGESFLDEFWPDHAVSDRLFQPEPGCSDPTFVGSAADMAILSSRMLNVLSEWLDSGDFNHAMGFGMRVSQTPSVTATAPLEAEFRWPADEVSSDLQRGYQIRLSPAAKAQILTWMKKSERIRGKTIETGGILFGQIDDFLKVVWVTAASGPPPDSVASRTEFVCGTRGVVAMNAELVARTRGAASFIGMWHTHPVSVPEPSPTDRSAMNKLLGSPDFDGRQFLMLIIGGYAATPTIAGSLFKRDE
jgi:integrative and conjugative element protein (TIGR02256 family)